MGSSEAMISFGHGHHQEPHDIARATPIGLLHCPWQRQQSLGDTLDTMNDFESLPITQSLVWTKSPEPNDYQIWGSDMQTLHGYATLPRKPKVRGF